MIRMIVADLDNTLLRGDKSISPYTVGALNRCRARGVKIAFATARSARAASRMLAQFTPDVFIGYGGALALAGDEVIHRAGIPADISARLIRACLAEPEIPYIMAINESAAHINRLRPSDDELPHYRRVDFSEHTDQSYLKISVRSANPGAVARVAANYPALDLLRYSGEDLYRFAMREAVKWNAIQAVAARFDISTGQIAAFGDDLIDLEMITRCGVGVAVANALDEVKAAADYICGSNEHDGVARWLEEHIL